MTDSKIDSINNELKDIENKRFDIEDEIHKNQNLQEDNFNNLTQSRATMNDIQTDFYRDEKLGTWLNDMSLELEQRQKKTEQLLEDKDNDLRSKKNSLNNKSEELISQRRKLY
ncbi:DUF3958 family protein [Companilactobacillus sp. DQM5]|uniref:DUF3958 family protein n=1 Tax=Companilactobacillus sp. DQM5 TaxID=3463359 RepID=UPI004058B6AA